MKSERTFPKKDILSASEIDQVLHPEKYEEELEGWIK